MKPCTMFLMFLIFAVGCSNESLVVNTPSNADLKPEDKQRLTELDVYWAEVSRAVGEGDFEAYKATCHELGVLVAGTRKNSQPLAEALARWKKEFDATKAGKMKTSVTFRFTERMGDATTAHESGIFLYTAKPDEGDDVHEYINFEALLIKQDGDWKVLMEYQKSKATEKEWDALK